MDLLASTEIREGNRGGRDQFSWEKVKEVSVLFGLLCTRKQPTHI